MADPRFGEAQAWIEQVTGQPFQGDFQEHLKSGVVLCDLINKLKPGTIVKINRGRMPFMQMENVNAYINASKLLGVPDQYNFVTIDLFEAKNLLQVAVNIVTLKRLLGFGFEKQAPAQVQDSFAREAPNPSLSRNIQISEEATTFAPGTGLSRTGDALRAGQGTVGEDKLAAICASCDRAISAGLINALNQCWHPNCFTCKKCGTKLAQSKFYPHNNLAYCDRCILIVNPQNKVTAVTRDFGFKFN